jgi:hypothetical protein
MKIFGSYAAEIDAEPLMELFGESVGHKLPSRSADGEQTPVKTESEVLRDLIAAGADTLDEIERRWRALLKKRAITLPFDRQVRRLAERLLRVTR